MGAHVLFTLLNKLRNFRKGDNFNILCTINLAIVLYGQNHPYQISSFICCHEDTSANHLTKFTFEKYRIAKRSGRAKVTFNFKTSG